LGSVRFNNPAQGIDQLEKNGRLASIPIEAIALDWDQSQVALLQEEGLERQPAEDAGYESLSAAANEPKNYKKWADDFGDYLYRTSKIDIWRSPALKQVSKPGESERDFRIRLSQLARENRDDKVEALRRSYATKMASLQDQIMRAQLRVERERDQMRAQSVQTAISFGTTLLGAILGRKTFSARTIDRAGTTMRGGMRTAREKGDVAQAEQSAEVLKQRLSDLEAELNSEIATIETETDPMQQKLEQVMVRPKKGDIAVRLTALVWAPYWALPDGTATPSY
jgi:phage host-nuclease inhibitor protein Gam